MLAEITLDAVLKIAQILVTVGVVVVGAWVRTALGRVTDRIERVERRVDATEQQTKQNSEAIRDGVHREDWIRETSRNRQTLERLIEGQARLDGRMDIGTRVAASLERLAAEASEGKVQNHGKDS